MFRIFFHFLCLVIESSSVVFLFMYLYLSLLRTVKAVSPSSYLCQFASALSYKRNRWRLKPGKTKQAIQWKFVLFPKAWRCKKTQENGLHRLEKSKPSHRLFLQIEPTVLFSLALFLYFQYTCKWIPSNHKSPSPWNPVNDKKIFRNRSHLYSALDGVGNYFLMRIPP
jgi:hypothetical protein